MNEKELEILINEAYENRDSTRVIELFESNKSIISKRYHSMNIKYLESLYNIGDFSKSLNILQEELNMPYIPMEYEDSYKDLYNICINAMKDRDFDVISTFSDDQIRDEIFNKESNLALLILTYLENKNIRLFLKDIRDYLKNENKQNYIKVFLFDVLKKQDVNEEFEVVSKVGRRYINPITNHYFDEQVVLTEAFAKMNDVIDDITLLEIMKELSIGICIGLFPLEFKLEDIDAIIAACHYTAASMLNNPIDMNKVKSLYNYQEDRFYLFLDLLKKDGQGMEC